MFNKIKNFKKNHEELFYALICITTLVLATVVVSICFYLGFYAN